MKTTPVEVTSRRGVKGGPAEVVGTANVAEYESLAEMVQALGSEEKVLALANTQHATNAKNDVRRLANVKLSDRKVREMAVERVLEDRDAVVEISQAEDMAAKKDELVNAAMAAIRQELEAKQAAAGATGAAEPQPSEEDDE